jgi:adenylate cyclase
LRAWDSLGCRKDKSAGDIAFAKSEVLSFSPYLDLTAAHALKGDIDEAKTVLAEARRLNPSLSIKWLIGRKPILQPWFDALRKAGLPEE